MMVDKYVVVEVDDYAKYIDHPDILRWGSNDDMVRIACDDPTSARIWTTKTDSVIVDNDRERIELEDAQILDVKIYNGVSDEQ